MREIKFRAWLPDSKEMLYKGSRMDLWGYSWLYSGGLANAIPMQFTGLKDKNGVEIYEGDRVRTTKGIVYEIFYTTKTARWAGKTLNVWTDDINTYFYKALAWLASRCEICGNIYEHPELLEDK